MFEGVSTTLDIRANRRLIRCRKLVLKYRQRVEKEMRGIPSTKVDREASEKLGWNSKPIRPFSSG